MAVKIRAATTADTDVIAHYNQRIAEETENRTLDLKILTNGVRKLLADSDKGRYWLAENDGEPVGQIMVTYEWSDWRDGMLWWIQSVYVAADFRRAGVFSALYYYVESQALEDRNVRGLRLYVERENTSAQETYATLGMTHPGYQVMQTMFDRKLNENGATSC